MFISGSPPSRDERTEIAGEPAWAAMRRDQERTWTHTTHRLDALTALGRPRIAQLGVAASEGPAVGEGDKGEDGEGVVDEHGGERAGERSVWI